MGKAASASAAAAVCLLVVGCGAGRVVAGSPTWPGATLAEAALGPADFPDGVSYDLITEEPGRPDGAGGPSPMRSRPEGCSDALTDVIANSGERGAGSALKYLVGYDGARIVMTLLSWSLDMDRLSAAASRCAQFEAFFDPDSTAIPITTTELSGLAPEALAYQQTMTLNKSASSVFMAFQNVGRLAAFAIAYPTPDPDVEAKATLPRTFLEVFSKQIAKMRSS